MVLDNDEDFPLVTVIANNIGTCIDYRVKTKNCHACKFWKGEKGQELVSSANTINAH